MDHVEKHGSAISAQVNGEEIEATTAEEQMAAFMINKDQKEAEERKKKEDEKWEKSKEEFKKKMDEKANESANENKEHSPSLWGGRFEKQVDREAFDFNASITFDKRLLSQDIIGSCAHAAMLKKTGVIEPGEADNIIHALTDIQKDVDEGKLEVDSSYEDIHSFLEENLIKRLGDTGKKVHTGRSRNDQVALDMRLYIRSEVIEVDDLLKDLLYTLLGIMEKNITTIMPGFTHLQKAQPTTLAHHMGAYFEMFKRDRGRMEDIYGRMNFSPLGSGAFAGTTYPLDREYTAQLMGFYGPTLNSMDGVSDRDYLIEFLSALNTIMMHLSRFCEEIIIWNSNEYRFVTIDDAYSTGSSIMPQKKNPDIAELIRGKTGRVYGAYIGLLTAMKGLPLAYNKDMQEDKEGSFDAIDTVKDSLKLFNGMIDTITFNNEVMENSAKNGFTNATDVADYLVRQGMPFRDAHGVVGEIVLMCEKKGCAIDDLTLDELKGISDLFEDDIYDEISMESCVNRRLTQGAPGKGAMEPVVEGYRAYLMGDWKEGIV